MVSQNRLTRHTPTGGDQQQHPENGKLAASSRERSQKIYIQLFSVHGLIRSRSPELGRDADTGGQVKYVLELAQALAAHDQVGQVDLITRLVDDKTVSPDYAVPMEQIADKTRIVRIQCGGKKYLPKERLWPHLYEMVDKAVIFSHSEHKIPDVVHGHYADGGFVAMEIARLFGIPFLFTGHSLGRHKKKKLLDEKASLLDINRKYRIDHRIGMEDECVAAADAIIASTRHEIRTQYGMYRNFSEKRSHIIAPGIDLSTFHPYYNARLYPEREPDAAKQARMALISEMNRFWVAPDRPFILALCRPDERKNISGLIEAYGRDKELQAMANLAIFAGIRRDIKEMGENERQVLTDMLLAMDAFDLYGKMAIPKRHDFQVEVPELYRLCADFRGVFVNPALVEPFGLTLIEAAACGLPVVATNDGGPQDILANCKNGVLVQAERPRNIASAVKKLLTDEEFWTSCSQNGINNVGRFYSWQAHSRRLLDVINKLLHEYLASAEAQRANSSADSTPIIAGRRLSSVSHFLVTDIDNTLVGDDQAMQRLFAVLATAKEKIAWGVATGRSLELTQDILKTKNIPHPDFIISSVGTEIHYGTQLFHDRAWAQHLRHRWQPGKIRGCLERFPFLEPQGSDSQREFKISYYMEEDPDDLARVHQALHDQRLRCQAIYSHGRFLDILPYRGGKGRAIRYLSYKWGMDLDRILVCGDSGNDRDMLVGDTCGVVVGNHADELNDLRGRRRIHFSESSFAGGIMDGLAHYAFLTPLPASGNNDAGKTV